jgi:hypothetical protein
MDYDAGSKLYWFDDYGQYRLPERIFLPVSYLVDSTASTQSFIQFKENSNEIIDGNTGVTSSYFETNWITYWKDRMKSFEYHTHLDDAYKVEPSFTFESSNYLSGIFTYTASNITTNLSNFQNLVPITSEKVSRFRDTSVAITAPVASYNLYFYKFLGIWAVTIPLGQVAPKKGDVIEIESGIFKGRFIINKIFSEIDGADITYYQYFYTDFNENILNNLNGFSGSMKVKNLNKYATTKGGIKDFTTSYDTSGYSSGIFRKVPGDNRSSFDINVNSAGEITSITLIDPGFGFNVGSTFNIASGGVFGGIVDITVSVTELDYNSEFLQNFKSHYISYAYDIEVVDEYIPLPDQSPIGVTQSFQITGKYQGFPTKTVRYNKLFPPREKTNLITPIDRHNVVEDVQAGHTCVHQHILQKEHQVQNVIYSKACTDITFFMFPHAGFVNVLSQLGFNQNDGIINLMPIAAYCDGE